MVLKWHYCNDKSVNSQERCFFKGSYIERYKGTYIEPSTLKEVKWFFRLMENVL